MRNVIDEVQDIFRDVFDESDLLVTKETKAEDIEDWDSMAQLNLVVLLEKHFKIKFKVDEIVNLKNVGEMVALIEERIK